MEHLMMGVRPAFLAFTETWMAGGGLDLDVALEEYPVFWSDIDKTVEGDGVIPFIKKDISKLLLESHLEEPYGVTWDLLPANS